VDRAISDLAPLSASSASAGFSLLELYRDVKTGHAAEAIEIFEQKRELFRAQLGHRQADAWVLLARAFDMVNRAAEAAQAYAKATLLSPISELQWRLPRDSCHATAIQPGHCPHGDTRLISVTLPSRVFAET